MQYFNGTCVVLAGDEAALDPFMDTALMDAFVKSALLWTLPWVTSYAAISSGRGACSLSPSVRARLGLIRFVLYRSSAGWQCNDLLKPHAWLA